MSNAKLRRREIKNIWTRYGWLFKQVKEGERAFIFGIYANENDILTNNILYYEVFEKRTDKRVTIYPSASDFGIWAWTYPNYDDAIVRFEHIETKKKGDNNPDINSLKIMRNDKRGNTKAKEST